MSRSPALASRWTCSHQSALETSTSRKQLHPVLVSCSLTLSSLNEDPKRSGLEVESFGGDFESPFEEEVAQRFRTSDIKRSHRWGCPGFRIDLGVIDPRQPGRFVLGVEADGATYHSTPTARDRDRLRQQVLENLGWRIHRIWSWDWVRERHREVARLQGAIKAAIEAAGSAAREVARRLRRVGSGHRARKGRGSR